jgi:hypothetical protein
MADKPWRVRQAALLLHGLPPAVRRKVVARLDVSESSVLQPLLVELAELGVPVSLGRQLQQLATPTAREPGVDASTAQELVERLSPQDVVARLAPCAPMTAAMLLRARDWPWKTQALQSMPDARRVAVLTCMRSDLAPLAPAVFQALCERLCMDTVHVAPQVADHSASQATHTRGNRRGSLRTRIRNRVRRMMGWMR